MARWSACRLTRRMRRRSKRFLIGAPRRIGARVEINIARQGGSQPVPRHDLRAFSDSREWGRKAPFVGYPP